MKIDHIGIAVKDIEAALGFFRDRLGLELHAIEVVVEQRVKTASLAVGGSHIELLEPTEPDSPVGKFLDRKGEGVHHIAFGVDDIEARLEQLAAAGVRLIDSKPRVGAGGKKIAFIHPKATNGVLIELCSPGE